MKNLSPWIVGEGNTAMRFVLGTDCTDIANRVAFIENYCRVRVEPFTTPDDDFNNWKFGGKGDGGDDPISRQWCDNELVMMGYVLTNNATEANAAIGDFNYKLYVQDHGVNGMIVAVAKDIAGAKEIMKSSGAYSYQPDEEIVEHEIKGGLVLINLGDL